MSREAQAASPLRATRPVSPNLHLFGRDEDTFALDVETGRLLELSPEQAEAARVSLQFGDVGRAELLTLGLRPLKPAPVDVPREVPLRALSLAVAQKCNLGCTYCYAQQGTFGGQSQAMSDKVARRAVDRLLSQTESGDAVTLGFMGGEPLTHRATLHRTVRYAAREAHAKNVHMGFSLTTNATLIKPEDIELFQRYRFTLNVSVDGMRKTNDLLRPFAGGRGSFDRVERNLKTLFHVPKRRFSVNARVTVTPLNLDIPATLAGLCEMDFDGIMFSPMLSSPSGKVEMDPAALDKMLHQMILCGGAFEEALDQGTLIPFNNVITQLKRIHQRYREHYPCGAGGGYMAVSAEGKLSACHRFVDDEVGHMGDLASGIDADAQSDWLETRTLEEQSPCGGCWARYLCSGSCHYEVLKRGRPACDYIRGWLHYCLSLYAELAEHKPDQLARVLASRTAS